MSFAHLSTASLLRPTFARDVAWNVGGLAAVGLAGVVVNGLILASRGSETLGVFNQVFAVYIVLSQIAVGGVHLSVLRFVSVHAGDRNTCAAITATGMLLATLLSLVVCAAVWLASDTVGRWLGSPAVAGSLPWMLPGLAFFSLNKVMRSALNGVEAMRAYAVFDTLRYVLILTGVTVILGFGLPGLWLPGALSFAEIVLFVSMVSYTNARWFRLGLGAQPGRWLRQHVSFGARGCFGGILTEMNTRVDVLILGLFCGDATVGLYSFAAILAEGFAQIPVVIRKNTDPVIAACFATGDRQRIAAIAARVRRVFWPLLAAAGVLAVAAYPGLLWLLDVGTDVVTSWVVFAILIAGVLVASGWRPFYGILLQGGRPATQTLLVAGLVVCNVALTLLFTRSFQAYGAATATALLFVLEAVCVILLARRLFGVRL